MDSKNLTLHSKLGMILLGGAHINSLHANFSSIGLTSWEKHPKTHLKIPLFSGMSNFNCLKAKTFSFDLKFLKVNQ